MTKNQKDSSMTATGITHQVQSQYEQHPYPGYPLWIPLRWQDGYIGASAFSRQLCREWVGEAAFRSTQRPVLLAGCGDTQMAILRNLEPAFQSMIGVDISLRNLRRTRLRMWHSLRPVELQETDLQSYLTTCREESFSHIDAYGVLHHLSDPSATLAEMARCLTAGGTLRLMVYNTPARRWIHGIQQIFRCMGLSFYHPAHVVAAQEFLQTWCQLSPALQSRCAAMGPSILRHKGRFVDTFLHVREARISPQEWMQRLAQVGLMPVGLLDRYGEWDAYPNPLWTCPSAEEMQQRAISGGFSHNLELFLCKRPGFTTQMAQSPSKVFFSRLHLRTPPILWFSFPETYKVSLWHRMSIWWRYLNEVYGGKKSELSPHIPLATAQRLARLGAILPGGLSPFLRTSLRAPMQEKINIPEGRPVAKIQPRDMQFLLDKAEAILRNQKNLTPRRRFFLGKRIEAVQGLIEK